VGGLAAQVGDTGEPGGGADMGFGGSREEVEGMSERCSR